MTLKISITAAGLRDINDATDWYEAQRPGLGHEFADALDALEARIASGPGRFPVLRGEVRRASLRRYPYVLLFRVEADAIRVLACFHTRQNPRRIALRIRSS